MRRQLRLMPRIDIERQISISGCAQEQNGNINFGLSEWEKHRLIRYEMSVRRSIAAVTALETEFKSRDKYHFLRLRLGVERRSGSSVLRNWLFVNR